MPLCRFLVRQDSEKAKALLEAANEPLARLWRRYREQHPNIFYAKFKKIYEAYKDAGGELPEPQFKVALAHELGGTEWKSLLRNFTHAIHANIDSCLVGYLAATEEALPQAVQVLFIRKVRLESWTTAFVHD